jgi:hypothetical protein
MITTVDANEIFRIRTQPSRASAQQSSYESLLSVKQKSQSMYEYDAQRGQIESQGAGADRAQVSSFGAAQPPFSCRAQSRPAAKLIAPARHSTVRLPYVLERARAEACSLSSWNDRRAKTPPSAGGQRVSRQPRSLSHARDRHC